MRGIDGQPVENSEVLSTYTRAARPIAVDKLRVVHPTAPKGAHSELAAAQGIGGQLTKGALVALGESAEVEEAEIQRHFGDVAHP